ncbi:unnamed protein product [Cuscuta campestris]|uniref:Uncharacterized protein n=1 Tax=Cuscuta campestris TaxID=132261 RepID=A0A484LI07_9ASTE|nr:unnamed protein product [Cuscuta campestris]
MGGMKEEVVSSSSSETHSESSSNSSSSSSQNANSTSYSDGRMSNGHLVVDYLCKNLDLPPLPPYQGGKNSSSSSSSEAAAAAESGSSSSKSGNNSSSSSSNSQSSASSSSSEAKKSGASSSNSGSAGGSTNSAGSGGSKTGGKNGGSANTGSSSVSASESSTGKSSASGSSGSVSGESASSSNTGSGSTSQTGSGSTGTSSSNTGSGSSSNTGSGSSGVTSSGGGSISGSAGASASVSADAGASASAGISAGADGKISAQINFSFGINFAISGSTFLAGNGSVAGKPNPLFWAGNPLPFQTEIEWFKEFLASKGCKSAGDARCKAEVENALFWLGSVGLSDYSRVEKRSAVNLRGISQLCIIHIAKLLRVVLEAGAKYIVVQGLPPVGCLPVAIAPCPFFLRDHMGCSAVVNTAIDIHNRLLIKTIESFRRQYPGSTIVYADYWKAFMEIFTNSHKYKFEERTKVCCGAGGGDLNFDPKALCGSAASSACKSPWKYISWDGIHFTDAMNEKLADLFFKGDYCDPPFSELVSKRKSSGASSS